MSTNSINDVGANISDKRYQHLESGLSDLNARVTGLETKLDSQGASLHQVSIAIDGIRHSLGNIGKANPSLYVSIIVACVSVLGLGALVGSMALNPIRNDHTKLEQSILRHDALPGHASAISQHTRSQEAINRIDEGQNQFEDSLKNQTNLISSLRERVAKLEITQKLFVIKNDNQGR